jgi:hypothetical protein
MNFKEALALHTHDLVLIKSLGETAEVLVTYVDHATKEVIVYVEREDGFSGGVKHTEIRHIEDLE